MRTADHKGPRAAFPLYTREELAEAFIIGYRSVGDPRAISDLPPYSTLEIGLRWAWRKGRSYARDRVTADDGGRTLVRPRLRVTWREAMREVAPAMPVRGRK